jgi:hypothetical protein
MRVLLSAYGSGGHCILPGQTRAPGRRRGARAIPKGWTFTTTLAKDIRCSIAGYPISTSSTPRAHCALSRCCTVPAPSYSTSASPETSNIGPWADRVLLIDAEYAGTWELPAIGVVTGPTAVLVRPDGYAAWVGDHTQQGLAQARTTWFGLFNRRRIL